MPSDHTLAKSVADAVVEFVSTVPVTREAPPVEGVEPASRAREIRQRAAIKASLTSGSLALPPGPIGMLTILPDLIAVWHIQSQMVADIAGVYGQSATLTREQMMYCLFRHAAAQAVRDLVVRVGERYVFRRASLRVVQNIAARIGVKLSQRAIATTAARWLPAIGAAGVAAYAFYDTARVGDTAIELFGRGVQIVEGELDP